MGINIADGIIFQNLGKTLRTTNYSFEIYQLEPVYCKKTADQLATQVNFMISIKPNQILEIFRAIIHQSLSDIRINSDDD